MTIGARMNETHLERLAVEVPDLDAWIPRFEPVLGPGFRRYSVQQATGEVQVAVHPAGVELLAKPGVPPRLRSFHLRSPDLARTVERARSNGWQEVDSFDADGRRHVAFDVAGLRVLVLEAAASQGETASRSGAEATPDPDERIAMYRAMLEIRHFENRVFDLFAQGEVAGSTHLCQGQEAVAVGACRAIRRTDLMVCTYRGHGQCLAKGMDLRAAMAEILGRSTGCCGGKGGSMHLTDVSVGAMGSFAIVGAGIPVAAGLAWAAQTRETDQVVLSFFGDGATNIGAFHEGLNLASVWKLPVVFICENNLYGEYSPIATTTPLTDLADRAVSYGMPGVIVDGNDVLAVRSAVAAAVDAARAGDGPTLLECKTYRQKGHSRGDLATYRPPGELDHWLSRDPISLFRAQLVEQGVLTDERAEQIDGEAKKAVRSAEKQALDDPFPESSALLAHTYAEEL